MKRSILIVLAVATSAACLLSLVACDGATKPVATDKTACPSHPEVELKRYARVAPTVAKAGRAAMYCGYEDHGVVSDDVVIPIITEQAYPEAGELEGLNIRGLLRSAVMAIGDGSLGVKSTAIGGLGTVYTFEGVTYGVWTIDGSIFESLDGTAQTADLEFVGGVGGTEQHTLRYDLASEDHHPLEGTIYVLYDGKLLRTEFSLQV